MTMQKTEGSANEYLYVLPPEILNHFKFSRVIRQLYMTDLGFYPSARAHYVHREHGANAWILIFCTHGRGEVRSATKTWPVTRGSIVLLPPDRLHTYYASAEAPWDIFWVHFTGALVADYLPQEARQGDGFVHVQLTAEADISLLMSQFGQMIRSLSTGFSFEGVFYASQVLAMTLAYIALQTESARGDHFTSNDYITQTIQYIYAHLSEPITAAQLTAQVGVSESYLNRIFRQTVGTSINRFVTDIRTQQASHYLQDTALSVQQIAQRVGYADQYYFSRVFKKRFGVAPRTYRQQRHFPPPDPLTEGGRT